MVTNTLDYDALNECGTKLNQFLKKYQQDTGMDMATMILAVLITLTNVARSNEEIDLYAATLKEMKVTKATTVLH